MMWVIYIKGMCRKSEWLHLSNKTETHAEEKFLKLSKLHSGSHLILERIQDGVYTTVKQSINGKIGY